MKKLRIILRWTAALMTLAMAAALILSCLALYRSSTAPENLTAEGVRINDIYTWENGAQSLRRMAPLTVLWAVVVLLAAMLPTAPGKRPGMDPENALRLLRPRVEETPAMGKQKRYRRIIRMGTGAVVTVCLGVMLLYMTDGRHFTSWDLELVMGDMVRHLALPACLILLALCLCQVGLGRSYAAEWSEAKLAPKRPVPEEKPVRRDFPVGTVRIVLAVAAVGLIALGILNGGMYDVLVKAINICTECIGLG